MAASTPAVMEIANKSKNPIQHTHRIHDGMHGQQGQQKHEQNSADGCDCFANSASNSAAYECFTGPT